MAEDEKKDKRWLARRRLRRMRELARQRKTLGEKQRGAGAARSQPPAASKALLIPRTRTSQDVDAASEDRKKQRQLEIDALERNVAELRRLPNPTEATAADIERIHREVEDLKRDFYENPLSWQKLLLARHPQRPYTDDFIRLLFENFSELHGDRNFGDDPALLTGMAWFHGKPVMIVGSRKGRDTKQRVTRNFGQAKPEGYRKALRAMQLAAKFNRPIIVFIDTPGAYPGMDAEERGQAEAIAHNLREMSRLPVPIIVTVTGEGGSGGALAIAVGDRIFMLENSIYSVISPEGCASIMWRDSTKTKVAAEALKIGASDLMELKMIDEIVPEPEGGAHTDHAAAAKLLDPFLSRALDELAHLSAEQLVGRRYLKFRSMGLFFA